MFQSIQYFEISDTHRMPDAKKKIDTQNKKWKQKKWLATQKDLAAGWEKTEIC